MTNQLPLIDTQPEWRLDERTRRVGREGVAQARAALQAVRRSRSQGPPDGGRQPGVADRPAAARPAAAKRSPRPHRPGAPHRSAA